MLELVYENRFKKQVEQAKNAARLQKLLNIIVLLAEQKPYKNHKLSGNFKDYWECHIEPDWLLIYKKTATEIILSRTGTHSDLF